MKIKSYTLKNLSKFSLPLLTLIVLLACHNNSNGQKAFTLFDRQLPKADTCTLLFVGDVMSHSPQIKSAYRPESRSYDYNSCFDSLRTLISSADLAVANLETPLAGKPYRGYPQFSAPDALAKALQNAGFDILGTSNNHTADRGRKGAIRTLDVLDNLGLKHFGSYRSAEEREEANPLILEVKGIRLALLAYTYGLNGMPMPKPAVVDTIQREQMSLDLWRADSLGADYKIVFIHWGEEYQSKPNKAQKDLAEWLHEEGADAIIGSHPHVVQGSAFLRDSIYDDTFVAYSLGNFISNQRTPPATRGGLMLGLRLVSRMEGKPTDKAPHRVVRLDSVSYNFAFVNKRTPKGKLIYRLLPLSLESKNVPEELPQKEQKDWQDFVNYCNKLKFVY